MKTKTMVVLVLAVLAGLLSGAVLTTPTVHAMNGSVHGGVYWTDQHGDMYPMAWAKVSADDGVSPPITAYTTDGSYAMWLPPGTYTLTASSDPGFYPASTPNVVVSAGSSTGLDFTLQPTGKPVPELPPWAQPLILLSAIVVTIVCLRRYRPRPQA